MKTSFIPAQNNNNQIQINQNNNQTQNIPKIFKIYQNEYQTIGEYAIDQQSSYTALESLLTYHHQDNNLAKNEIEHNSSSSSSSSKNGWTLEKIEACLKNLSFENTLISSGTSNLHEFKKDGKSYFIYEKNNIYYHVSPTTSKYFLKNTSILNASQNQQELTAEAKQSKKIQSEPKTLTYMPEKYFVNTVGDYIEGEGSAQQAVKNILASEKLLSDITIEKIDTSDLTALKNIESFFCKMPNFTTKENHNPVLKLIQVHMENASGNTILNIKINNTKEYAIFFNGTNYYCINTKKFNSEKIAQDNLNSKQTDRTNSHSSSISDLDTSVIHEPYKLAEPQKTKNNGQIDIKTDKIQFDKPFKTFEYLFNDQISRATHGEDCLNKPPTLDSQTRSKYMAILLFALKTAIDQLKNTETPETIDIKFENSSLRIKISMLKHKISIFENEKCILAKQLDLNKFKNEKNKRDNEFKNYLQKKLSRFGYQIDNYKTNGFIPFFNEDIAYSITQYKDLANLQNTNTRLTLAYLGCDQTSENPAYKTNIINHANNDRLTLIDGISSFHLSTVHKFEARILEGITSCLTEIIEQLNKNDFMNIKLYGQGNGGYIAAAVYTYLQHFLNQDPNHHAKKISAYLNKKGLYISNEQIKQIKNKNIYFHLFLSNPLLGGLVGINYTLDHDIPAPANENQKVFIIITNALYMDTTDKGKQFLLDKYAHDISHLSIDPKVALLVISEETTMKDSIQIPIIKNNWLSGIMTYNFLGGEEPPTIELSTNRQYSKKTTQKRQIIYDIYDYVNKQNISYTACMPNQTKSNVQIKDSIATQLKKTRNELEQTQSQMANSETQLEKLNNKNIILAELLNIISITITEKTLKNTLLKKWLFLQRQIIKKLCKSSNNNKSTTFNNMINTSQKQFTQVCDHQNDYNLFIKIATAIFYKNIKNCQIDQFDHNSFHYKLLYAFLVIMDPLIHDDRFTQLIIEWDQSHPKDLPMFMRDENAISIWEIVSANEWLINFDDSKNSNWMSNGMFPDQGSKAQDLFKDKDNHFKIDGRAYGDVPESEEEMKDMLILGLTKTEAEGGWALNHKKLFHLARSKLAFILNYLQDIPALSEAFGKDVLEVIQLKTRIIKLGENESFLTYCFEQAKSALGLMHTSEGQNENAEIQQVKELFFALKGL